MVPHLLASKPRASGALAFFVLAAVVFAGATPARATEGGTSHYIQGAYGDYLMGYIPAPGFYVRNDTMYLSQSLEQSLKAGKVYGKVNASTVMDLLKLSFIFDAPAIGGYAGFGAAVPVIFDTNVGGDINMFDPRSRLRGFSKSGDGNRGGLSDILLMPVILGWNMGECHLVFSPVVFLPTGYYDKKILTNLGMNYFTFDANMAFTWLSKAGYEFSVNAGYMVNTENQATRYLSGNQLHVDWTAAYHVNERFALGLVGYAVAQTTPDSGKGASMGSYMSSGVGIGPTATYTVPVGGKGVSFIAKWLHDVGGDNRLKGDVVYGSIAVKF